MQRDLEWVLINLDISIEELTKIINQEGGRPHDRPIIYAEQCANISCGARFFSNTQDHQMRASNGYPNLCPGCREVDRREKKRQYAKNRTKTAAWMD